MDRLVYLHRRNDTNAIFYVGMGTMKRAKCHCGRNKLWNRIVKKHGYTVQIICKNLTSQEAKLIERILIKKYKEMGMDLCNLQMVVMVETAGFHHKNGKIILEK